MNLYRYRSINSQNLSRIFTHCELYFAAPREFNDPFDCNPPFSINKYCKNDLREHFEKKSTCPKVSCSEREALIENNVQAILKDNSLFQSEIITPLISILSEENSTLGVLCLSEKPDDILMWSHYTNGHKGIVLQFDRSVLARKNSNFGYCKKVDYDNNTITLRDINRNLNQSNSGKLARQILLKKAKKWKYEKEWRIIVDPSSRKDIANCRIFTFPKEALTGVILGCEIVPEDEYAIRMWLKEGNHNARIFKAVKDISTYAIKIGPPLGDYNT